MDSAVHDDLNELQCTRTNIFALLLDIKACAHALSISIPCNILMFIFAHVPGYSFYQISINYSTKCLTAILNDIHSAFIVIQKYPANPFSDK